MLILQLRWGDTVYVEPDLVIGLQDVSRGDWPKVRLAFQCPPQRNIARGRIIQPGEPGFYETLQVGQWLASARQRGYTPELLDRCGGKLADLPAFLREHCPRGSAELRGAERQTTEQPLTRPPEAA